MGRDKAALPAGPGPGDGTLARRTADVLSSVCAPVLEVGPGRSGRPAVADARPGSGPLAALVTGWTALREGGSSGAAIVVATDLPKLSIGLLEWLRDRPGGRSVVPVAAGRVQPLCARWSAHDLDVATHLVAEGRLAMWALIEATDPALVTEVEWAGPAGGTAALIDVDTPEDLERVTDA